MKKLLAIPYMPILLGLTSLWFAGSTYWYVCETQSLCSNDSGAVTAESETPDLDESIAAVIPDVDAEVGEVESVMVDSPDIEVGGIDAPDVDLDVPDVDINADLPDVEVDISSDDAMEEVPAFDRNAKVEAFFNPDQSTFRNNAWHEDARGVAEYLSANESESVTVAGYAAMIDSPADENDLSEARAQALKDYLVANGAREDQISTEVKAFADPVGDNTTADGRAQNRRAVLQFN